MLVVSILTTIALALGLVSWGMDVGQAVNKETDRSYASAALQQVRERQAQLEQELVIARQQNDVIAVAEIEALRDGVAMIERRWNPSAQVRQAEQARAAFIEEGQRRALIDISTGVVSRAVGGLGKVQGSYIKGTNWPPPPGKSIVTWDHQAKQAVRIMLETDRPSVTVVQLVDDLEDELTIVTGVFDVLKGTSGSGNEPGTAQATYEGIGEELGRLDNLRALPSTVGDYLVESLVKKVRADNPQIASLPMDERVDFLRDQACRQLRGIQARESDLRRSEALLAAQGQLGCAPLASEATPSATSTTAATATHTTTQAASHTPTHTLVRATTAAAARTFTPVPTRTATSASTDAVVWVRQSGAIVNKDNQDLDYSSSTHTRVFQATETFFSWKYRDGEDYVDIVAKFGAPPEVIMPGETVEFTVSFAGTANLASFWTEFEIGIGKMPPTISKTVYSQPPPWEYSYTPWDPNFSGPSTATLKLTMPERTQTGDTIEFWANYRPCYPCDVTWTYRAERR